jgi:hypothetical protein
MVEIIVHVPSASNIYSSGNSSGGTLALHELVKCIQTAYASDKPYDISDKKNTLIIYGENEYGNKYKGNHVLRWICLDLHFYPKWIQKTWNYKDLICHWESSDKNTFLLNVLSINPLYKHLHLKRKGTCHLYKKRLHKRDPIIEIHPKDSICIDDLPTVDVVRILNSVEVFYSYDEYTWINLGAILCHCKLVIVPFVYKTKNEFIKDKSFDFPKFPQMFAWGKDDMGSIEYTEDDIHELKEFVQTRTSLNVTRFLKNIDDYFNNRPHEIPTVFDLLYDKYTPFIAVDQNIDDELYFIDFKLDLHTANLHESGHDFIFHKDKKSFYIRRNSIHLLKDSLETIHWDDIREFIGCIFNHLGNTHIICKNESVQNGWGTFVDVVRINGKWFYEGDEFVPQFFKRHPNPPNGNPYAPKKSIKKISNY